MSWNSYVKIRFKGDYLAALEYIRALSITELKDYSWKWQERLKSFLQDKKKGGV